MKSIKARLGLSATAFFWGVVVGALAVVSAPGGAEAQRTLYTVAKDNFLRTVDPSTGETIAVKEIVLSGKTVDAATGLAAHPGTQVLYALLKLKGQTGRELVTIDPDAGPDFATALSIGNTELLAKLLKRVDLSAFRG